MGRVSLFFPKRISKKVLINCGLIRPGGLGRHGLVGDIELAEMKRKFQIAFLKERGLKPGHKFLDIGCGTLRGGIPIIDFLNESNYCGIDVRRNVLEEARKEIKEHGLEHKKPLLVLESDAQENLKNNKFDFIWAFSALIHMDDNILGDTMNFVSRHLDDNGVLYANVNIGKDDHREWQGFPVITHPLTFYEREAKKTRFKIEVLGSLESLGHISNKGNQDQQIMLKLTKKEVKLPC